MLFLSSLDIFGLMIFIAFVAALFGVVRLAFYNPEHFRNRPALLNFAFFGAIVLFIGAMFCAICIGRDWGREQYRGTPAHKLTIGEVYRVHAQGGDAYILSKNSGKDQFFYRATRQKNAVSEGTTFVVDRTGMWRETTTKWSGTPGELGPSK